MKKIIILSIALLTNALVSFSQPAVNGGLTLSWGGEYNDEQSKMLTAYNAGFTYDFGDDTRHYAFRPGLSFCVKGWRLDGNIGETQSFINYMVELPFRWVHKIRITDDVRLELGYGCYFDFGVGGTVKVKYPSFSGDYEINGTKQTINYDEVVKKFPGRIYKNDNGTLLNIGISTNRYYAGATFQSGWQGVNTFLINVGYFFKPCGERPAHPERPKRDPDREYLWGH